MRRRWSSSLKFKRDADPSSAGRRLAARGGVTCSLIHKFSMSRSDERPIAEGLLAGRASASWAQFTADGGCILHQSWTREAAVLNVVNSAFQMV